MAERLFEFVEGTSSKFWAITVDGAEHTVRFGKIGTAGQAKTKSFASPAAATADADKLIREKTGKGYVEKTAAPAAKAAAPAPAKGKKTAKAEPPAESAPPPPTPAPAGPLPEIRLDPRDRLWVTYGPRPTIPPDPEPRPFDQAACLKELQTRARPYTESGGKIGHWLFDAVRIPANISAAEGHFWLTAFAKLKNGRMMSLVVAELGKMTFDGKVSADIVRTLCGAWHRDDDQVLKAVRAVLTPDLFFELLSHADGLPTAWHGVYNTADTLPDMFRERVLPQLSDKQLDECRKLLRPWVAVTHLPTSNHDAIPLAFPVAALCGMAREMTAVLKTLPDGAGAEPDSHLDYYWQPQRLIFGLGSAAAVETEFRRLKLLLTDARYVRAWVAHTGTAALDVVRDSILDKTLNKAEIVERLTAFASTVVSPAAAPVMLELQLDSKAPQIASAWLNGHVGVAVEGLLPAAAGRGKLATAALAYLRTARQKGFDFAPLLSAAPPETRAFLQLAVLGHEEKTYPDLDAKKTPGDIKAALAAISGKPPLDIDPATMPPLLIGEAKLPAESVGKLLIALKGAKPGDLPAGVVAVRKHVTPVSRDAFAWAIFERWQRDGYPPKEKWCFTALGLLGGDASAIKITPLVREWPGQGQHQRAVAGLDVLRTIGTDTALMQLNGIAQKVKFQGVKNRAREMMEAIAADRKMTKAELEDRIVPDLDLDERGGRVFDFGPRQFHMALSADLTPVVRDDAGKVRADLPAPAGKDDATKAAEAVAGWKLLKKQLRELLKLQGPRLEQAMVTGRRWPVADFRTLIVDHPVMTHLARRLVWVGYDAAGKELVTFRVTDERDYADAADKPVSLAKVAAVGIAHPLALPADVKNTWGQVFGDYEIVPPFPQLGRPTYTLDATEAKGKAIARFGHVSIPSGAVWGGTEKLGWTRGSSSDHGVVTEFVKHFPTADATAVFTIQPGIPRGYIDMLGEGQKITDAFFLPGKYDPITYPYHKDPQKLTLGKVNAVAVSETLADLAALAAKGS